RRAHPPTPCEKGGGPMDYSSLSFRIEIQDCLHAWDNLLAALSRSNTDRFSKEELEVLEYSVTELQKVLLVCDSEHRQSIREYIRSVREYLRNTEVLLKTDELTGAERQAIGEILHRLSERVLNHHDVS